MYLAPIQKRTVQHQHLFRNSGLHRRLLDGGSSRQLAVVNATNSDENHINCSAASADFVIGSTNISNSTSSLASNPSPSISIACNNIHIVQSAPATTSLASISSYPMVAPSSCIALRRPSANMFVIIDKIHSSNCFL